MDAVTMRAWRHHQLPANGAEPDGFRRIAVRESGWAFIPLAA
jgi:hypothetical protein